MNLNAAIGLTKIQEEYLMSTNKAQLVLGGLPSHSVHQQEGSNLSLRAFVPHRKVTLLQMDNKNAKRLCFYYKEK